MMLKRWLLSITMLACVSVLASEESVKNVSSVHIDFNFDGLDTLTPQQEALADEMYAVQRPLVNGIVGYVAAIIADVKESVQKKGSLSNKEAIADALASYYENRQGRIFECEVFKELIDTYILFLADERYEVIDCDKALVTAFIRHGKDLLAEFQHDIEAIVNSINEDDDGDDDEYEDDIE